MNPPIGFDHPSPPGDGSWPLEDADGDGSSRPHLRDLVALLALPALWKEKDPRRIAADLVEVLATLLRLDCAFVRAGDAVDVAALGHHREQG